MTREQFIAHLELHGGQLQKVGMRFQIVLGEIAFQSSLFDNGPWSAYDVWSHWPRAEWDAIGDEMLAGSAPVINEFFPLPAVPANPLPSTH